MSDSQLSATAPGTGTRSWLGWLFLSAAIVAAAGVAVLVNRLRERADECRRVQTELAFLDADAHELEALEWETIFKKTLSGESSEHLEKTQARMQERISRLGRVGPNLPVLAEFTNSYRAYVRHVDEEFKLIAAGKTKEAEEFDEAKVDPAFDALETALGEMGDAYDQLANRTLGQIRAGTLLVLLVGVGFIGALIWQFTKKRRVMEVAAAEQRLRDQHALILNAVSEGVHGLDLAGQITFENPASAAMLGCEGIELISRSAHGAMHHTRSDGTPYPESECPIHATLKDGRVRHVRDEVFWRKDGTSFPVEYTSTPLRDEEGRITGATVVFTDITERKRAEEALQERAKLAKLEAEVGVALTLGGTLTEMLRLCSEAIVRHLGGAFARIWTLNEREQMLELQASAGMYTHLNGPHGRVPVGKFKIGLIAEERKAHLTNQVVGDPRVADQEWAKREGLVAFAGYPLLIENRLVGVVAMFSRHTLTDTTLQALASISKNIAVGSDRKRAEERLAQEHDLGEAILNHMPGLFYLFTEKGRFLRWNHQFETVSGYTGEEIARMHPLDIFPAEHKGAVAKQILQVFKTGLGQVEANLLTKQGEQLPFHFSGGAVIVDGQPCLAGVGTDTTERKRLEAQVFESQKMETVGKLAGGIAHEFNSLLTAIIGRSELLLGDLPAGSPLATNATEISQAAGRAATLTRQLLAYGRKSFLRPESLDLNKVLANMEGTIRHFMGGDVDVRIISSPALHAVKADAGQIEQVIMNLVMNAADAMPNGGNLTLETANVSLDQESVTRYPELKPGDYVRLAITDTGRGMSEEVKARVFDPFFTTKGVGQGTGLGLATCYGIVKQSGGQISAYSELARGATFKIYLPRIEPQAKIPLQPLTSPDLPRGTETVLLAEDDPALREMATALLRRLGYTVLAAAHGIEALSLSHQPATGRIELLLTDVVMPHMGGKELADRVRALYPHARILFTSAYTEQAIVHQGVLDPGMALLQKPFTPSALAHKIREVLGQPDAPRPADAPKPSGFEKLTAQVNGN